MPFLPVLPGHASFSAQVEQKIGFERYVFTFHALGYNPGDSTLHLRSMLAAVLQRGVAAYYATGAMKDAHHTALPGELEEHLRPYIQEMASGHDVGVCEFSVMHKAHNGDLAGLTVTYNHVS